MEQANKFFDLCVPYNKDKKILREIIKELIELGYKTIAIDQTFDQTAKDAPKRGLDIFPQPHNLEYLRAEFGDQLKILHRITIIYADGAVSHAMTKSENLKKYDLIAGQPKTDAALTHCCIDFKGDLVTFDPNAGARLLVNRKAFLQALRRGMFFEIKYAPAISDSNNRKDMIKIAHNYCAKKNSNNIIFSSGATNAFELRGPYDVANLAYIFGLSEDVGKNAIDKHCQQLYFKSQSRRIGKTIMFVNSLGPIVYSSDSSDKDSSTEEDDDNPKSDKSAMGAEFFKDDDDDEEKDNIPPKKRRLGSIE